MGSTFGSDIDQNNIESEMQPMCITRYFSAKFRWSWAEKFDFNANQTSGHAGWPCQTHIAVSTVLVRLFHAWWHICKIEKSFTTYVHKCPVCFLSLLTHRTFVFEIWETVDLYAMYKMQRHIIQNEIYFLTTETETRFIICDFYRKV